MTESKTLRQLPAQWVTPENFQDYGQVIFPASDGEPDPNNEAQLNLENGTPRLYIMRLDCRGRKFHQIARHVECTQCLGAREGKDWFIAVAPPSQGDRPDLDRLMAFRIPGDCFIKLEMGTWHAGPYFDWDAMDFYNLELTDTNIVDFGTYNFKTQDNLEFEIVLS
ncbi:ureidoglycolate lyase [Phormidium sp. CCY1219]|uniref:ureidoglycolate lyase n=1 Tax=Phormidium sp. CCY1219 TaxID=2886104 RepID=UPI002D1EC923|nr:ureidoglycolate lyase [Phormidium sp. CCY1219]MEB3828903.1 ureidoglycolate lyase [Phormidium sp. CCY1219]